MTGGTVSRDAVRAGAPARARVTAGGVDTEYLRAGRGPALVLLAGRDDEVWTAEVARHLAGEFLVVAPRCPDGIDFTVWLADFLEGLGIERAHLVAAGAFGAPALAFASADDTRVARVALLCRGDAAPLTRFLTQED